MPTTELKTGATILESQPLYDSKVLLSSKALSGTFDNHFFKDRSTLVSPEGKVSPNPMVPRLLDKDDLHLLPNAMNISETVLRSVEKVNTPSAFYKLEPHFAHHVDKEAQNDFFFTLKRGIITQGIPAMLLWYLDQIKANGLSYNELANLMTLRELSVMMKLVPDDVNIVKLIRLHYQPAFCTLEEHRLKVPYDGYYEVFILSTDRVAFIENKVAEMLSDEDILSITVEKGRLTCNGTRLDKLKGGLGVTRGTYDLRSII